MEKTWRMKKERKKEKKKNCKNRNAIILENFSPLRVHPRNCPPFRRKTRTRERKRERASRTKFQILDDNILPPFAFDFKNRPSVEYLNSSRRKLFHPPRACCRVHIASLPLSRLLHARRRGEREAPRMTHTGEPLRIHLLDILIFRISRCYINTRAV